MSGGVDAYQIDWREVPLTGKHGRGRVTLVSADDYDRVMAAGPWRVARVNRLGSRVYEYVATRISGREDFLHRFILGLVPGDGIVADHVSGNSLDNRRSNLRACTPQDNARNCSARQGRGTSRFKGVCWYPRDARWMACIKVGAGKNKTLGYFDSEVEAARAYDEAARREHGEFAKTNRALGLLP